MNALKSTPEGKAKAAEICAEAAKRNAAERTARMAAEDKAGVEACKMADSVSDLLPGEKMFFSNFQNRTFLQEAACRKKSWMNQREREMLMLFVNRLYAKYEENEDTDAGKLLYAMWDMTRSYMDSR